MKSSVNPVLSDLYDYDIDISHPQQASNISLKSDFSENVYIQRVDQKSDIGLEIDHQTSVLESEYLLTDSCAEIPLLDLDSQGDSWLCSIDNQPQVYTVTETLPNMGGLDENTDLSDNKQELTMHSIAFGQPSYAGGASNNDSFYGEYFDEHVGSFSRDGNPPVLDIEDVLEVIRVSESENCYMDSAGADAPQMLEDVTPYDNDAFFTTDGAILPRLPQPTNQINERSIQVAAQPVSVAKHHDLRRILNKRHISESCADEDDNTVSGSDSDSEYSDSDNEDERNGDNDAPGSLTEFCENLISCGARTKPQFWQYNFQSRGPKGQRLCSSIELKDSHFLYEFVDPVFDNDTVLSCKHSGKARRGEGNDPQPNPKKLLQLGSRINSLEKKFQALSVKSSSCGKGVNGGRTANREKNVLASRICRLKKKAQHEANKLKLDGLKQEHGQLMQVLTSIVCTMDSHVNERKTGSRCHHGQLCACLDTYIRNHLASMIAGHTSEYVSIELEKAARIAISKSS